LIFEHFLIPWITPGHSVRRVESIPILSPIKNHRRSSRVDELQREFKMIKPLALVGEHQKDEDAEAWLLGMRKYFQLHNYSSQA
jgi:hypothetical protein